MSKRFLALLFDYAFFYPILGLVFLLALSHTYHVAPPFVRLLAGSGLSFAAFFFRDLFTSVGSPGNWLVGLKAPCSAASSILRALPAQLFPAVLIYAIALAERIFD